VIPPPANDGCVGAEQHVVHAGDSFSIVGSMAGALDDYQTFCGDDQVGLSYPDVVYQFDVAEICTLSVVVSGDSGFDPIVSLRSACATDEYCLNASSGVSETYFSSVDVGTYYVVVSSPGINDAFDIDVSCSAPVCGDGVLTSNEACDDGGVAPGDGCDASCELEVADPLTDTCSGASGVAGIAIAPGQSKKIPAIASDVRSTINASDSGTGSCQIFPDPQWDLFPSADHVYRITPSASGQVTVKLGNDANGVPFCGADQSVEPTWPYPVGCYDRSIHVREADCEDVGAEVACAESQVSWWAPEELTFAVSAGSDYYVFVDGWVSFGPGIESDDVGEYVLEIDMQ